MVDHHHHRHHHHRHRHRHHQHQNHSILIKIITIIIIIDQQQLWCCSSSCCCSGGSSGGSSSSSRTWRWRKWKWRKWRKWRRRWWWLCSIIFNACPTKYWRNGGKGPYLKWQSLKVIYIYIWVNYNISLTWIKAIWGWFPLLTMIPVRSQWGRDEIYPDIYVCVRLSQLGLSDNRVPSNLMDYHHFPSGLTNGWNEVLTCQTNQKKQNNCYQSSQPIAQSIM